MMGSVGRFSSRSEGDRKDMTDAQAGGAAVAFRVLKIDASLIII